MRKVFVQYDIDGSGLIDEDELTNAIVELISDDGGNISVQGAAQAAAQMIRMLNGKSGGQQVSEQAFLGWINKGSKMNGPKRRQFARSNESRRAMILLLRTVETLAAQENWSPRRQAVHRIFVKYDVDGSGHIDDGELAAMISELLMESDSPTTHANSSTCAASIIKHLDDSGNNLVEEQEFYDWIMKGKEMSSDMRDVSSDLQCLAVATVADFPNCTSTASYQQNV